MHQGLYVVQLYNMIWRYFKLPISHIVCITLDLRSHQTKIQKYGKPCYSDMTFFRNWKTGYLVEEDEEQTSFFLIIISKLLFEKREEGWRWSNTKYWRIQSYDGRTYDTNVNDDECSSREKKWIIFSRNPKLFLHFVPHYASRDFQWCYYVNISEIIT